MSSASFSDQARNAERAITRETKKLEFLKAVQPMLLYEFLNSSQSHNAKYAEWRYMGRFIEARDEYMVLEVFACTREITREIYSGYEVQGVTGTKTRTQQVPVSAYNLHVFYFSGIEFLKEVKLTDFPLYLPWAWKSVKFHKILKGEARIKIPK